MAISVIIAARNEAENLNRLLPHVLQQDHKEYEVIVVNDGSEDLTKELLRRFPDPKLRVLNLPSHKGKKYALTEGINHARYSNILLTDADCYPVSPYWAQRMDESLHYYDVVVGVSQYENNGSWLSEIIQFDTLFTVAQMNLACDILSRPHMATGRNLGFQKRVFTQVNGYQSQMDIPYGDDDLFINALGPEHRIGFIHDEKAQTVSVPKTTLADWYRQKRRHYSAGTRYSGKNFWFAMLFQQFWLWGTLCWYGSWIIGWNLFFILLVLKIVNWSFWWYCREKFQFKIRGWALPFYDFFFTFYFLIAGISVIFAKKHEWT